MKHVAERPYADPEAAARKLVALAAGATRLQYDRIRLQAINGPFLFDLNGTGSEFGAGLAYAVEKGWLWLHESGTYVKLMAPGEDLLGR